MRSGDASRPLGHVHSGCGSSTASRAHSRSQREKVKHPSHSTRTSRTGDAFIQNERFSSKENGVLSRESPSRATSAVGLALAAPAADRSPRCAGPGAWSGPRTSLTEPDSRWPAPQRPPSLPDFRLLRTEAHPRAWGLRLRGGRLSEAEPGAPGAEEAAHGDPAGTARSAQAGWGPAGPRHPHPQEAGAGEATTGPWNRLGCSPVTFPTLL